MNKKQLIQLQKVIICRVEKQNGSYKTHVNEFPEKYCLIIDKKAIDLEINCYYDFIKIPGYKRYIEIIEKKFNNYTDKTELLFCLSDNEDKIIINDKEQLKKIKNILSQFKNGQIPYVNDCITPQQYAKKTK